MFLECSSELGPQTLAEEASFDLIWPFWRWNNLHARLLYTKQCNLSPLISQLGASLSHILKRLPRAFHSVLINPVNARARYPSRDRKVGSQKAVMRATKQRIAATNGGFCRQWCWLESPFRGTAQQKHSFLNQNIIPFAVTGAAKITTRIRFFQTPREISSLWKAQTVFLLWIYRCRKGHGAGWAGSVSPKQLCRYHVNPACPLVEVCRIVLSFSAREERKLV